MADLLFASTPAAGHLGPVLEIAGAAHARGHSVRLITGSAFRDRVQERGVEYVSLQGRADFDHEELDAAFPGRTRKRGIAKLRFDVAQVFIKTIPPQFETVRSQITRRRPDAVVVDNGFAGVIPLLTGSPEWAGRPAVAAVGVLPMMISSRDVAPWGPGIPPSSSLAGRLRNRLLTAVVQRGVFGAHQRKVEEMLRDRYGYPPLGRFIFDWPLSADLLLQLTVRQFEYPRSDLPDTVRFVGPVLPAPASQAPLPSWWDELDGRRPVVVVTQGTVDNGDLGRLIVPTLKALATDDVLVIALTGGRPVELLGNLPANARAAEFVPFHALMPKTAVLVTNGGYGGVQFALSNAVPLVVAGDTEDKPEVAARVAWAGCGTNLRTGRPTSAAVAAAVRRELAHPHPALTALAEETARTNGIDGALDQVEQLVRPKRRAGA